MSSVSFKIEKPAPSFRQPHAPARASPLALAQGAGRPGLRGIIPRQDDDSSSDEDDNAGVRKKRKTGGEEREIGWNLDSRGGKHVAAFRSPSPEPLIIAPLANKDWRQSSRSSRNPSYLPPGAQASRSNDPVVTVEVDEGGPKEAGLVMSSSRRTTTRLPDGTEIVEEEVKKLELDEAAAAATPVAAETEEQKALNAILASANGEDDEASRIEAIPSMVNARQAPITEEEAFRRDVVTRPEESTSEDYARVPIEQFGMALLKGMGWKEGQAASKSNRKGLAEAYVPKARPALLGIGAKERVIDDGGRKRTEKEIRREMWKKKENDKKYVPIARIEKESGSSRGSTPARMIDDRPGSGRSSKRTSRSPSPTSSKRRTDDDYSRKRRDDDDDYRSDRRRREDSGRDDRAKSSRSDDRRGDDDRDYSSRRREGGDRGERDYKADDRDRDRDRRRNDDRDYYGSRRKRDGYDEDRDRDRDSSKRSRKD